MSRHQSWIVVLVSFVSLITMNHAASAQRVRFGGAPVPYYRPSIVIGIGYNTSYIYPNYYGAYPYTAPRYVFTPQASSYMPPTPEAQAPANAASIRVRLPDAKAKVWFDGTATTSTGTERLYHTGPLEPGNYTYRIRAAWTVKGEEMIQEQVVSVSAGKTAVVDFTRPVSDE
jgi:uncharacterized protein (TIGR03000 family)